MVDDLREAVPGGVGRDCLSGGNGGGVRCGDGDGGGDGDSDGDGDGGLDGFSGGGRGHLAEATSTPTTREEWFGSCKACQTLRVNSSAANTYYRRCAIGKPIVWILCRE